jgi:deoxyribonuclease-1
MTKLLLIFFGLMLSVTMSLVSKAQDASEVNETHQADDGLSARRASDLAVSEPENTAADDDDETNEVGDGNEAKQGNDANQSREGKYIRRFSEAKIFLGKNLDLFNFKTIYCGCRVQGKEVDLSSCGYRIQKDAKRARRLEWEHVVPAENFGKSFFEWREGAPWCRRGDRPFRGRKCAETNAQFQRMEADLYNLFPAIGELNGLRSNFSMAQLTGSKYDFGNCKAKIEDRKFEPMDFAKGVVARTYMNFEKRYPGHGVVSDKNRKLYEAWDKMYPVSALECQRWRKLENLVGYPHLFVGKCALL